MEPRKSISDHLDRMQTVHPSRFWYRLVSGVVKFGVRITRLLPRGLWLRIREEAAVVRRLDYGRFPIYMCVDSWIENDVRLHSCSKEPYTVEWIESRFKPGDVFYDVGANVGAYSLIVFKFLSGQTQIYAFEPGFVVFPQLCRNIYLNGASKAVVPLQIALAHQTSITPFNYQNLIPGGALHSLGAAIDYLGKDFQPVLSLDTLSYRLDDFVEQFGLQIPNHIKIDVDGAEYQVLQGSEKILGRQEVRSVLVEVNEERVGGGDIVRFLEERGFVLRGRGAENSLFCRKDAQD